MQNKKILFIGGIILMLIVLIVLKYSFDSRGEPAPEFPVVTNLPGEDNKNIPRDTPPAVKPLKIETSLGPVLLYDPREIGATSAMGSGIFSMTTLENINPLSFGVIFNESNGSFAIGLEREPLAQSRLDAEAYLQRALDVAEEDLCSLNIFVGVPNSINQFYSGQNLGISFCPGSVSLE